MDPTVQDSNFSQSIPDQPTPQAIPPAPKLSVLPFIFSIFLVISLAGVGVLAYQNWTLQQQVASLQSQPTPTSTLTPSTTVDPNGNQLPSTFTFKLPTGYQAMQSLESKASYGFDNYEYLVISKEFSITTEGLRSSTECGNLISGQFCLDKGKGWGQENDIADITLDGIPAKSFYMSGGVDNAYHVVQTTQKPLLELRMYVAGGGLDQTFSQILSTFKFLDQNTNPEGKFCGGIAANLPQNQCPEGYTCKMENNYLDAGGVCTKEL